MNARSDEGNGVVLIVAPIGKDAALAAQVLEQAGIAARTCAKLSEVAAQLSEATNAIVVTEESLIAAEVASLLDALAQQPPWSDIPLVVLTSSGGGDAVSLRALEIFGPNANITLLERPLRAVTLLSTLQVALRARRRQREVRSLIEQRETILASISDGFSALDREWRYIYANEKAAEYAGTSKELMIGRNVWELYPESVATIFEASARRALATAKPEYFERFSERWQSWFETRIYPAADGIVVLRSDITERKIAAIALEAAKREAEEANRAKDRFLAMLSHELRTPLTPVLMTIASLRRQTDIPDELRRDLEVLQRNVELEALLIDDLLDLTRIAHDKLELHRDAVDIHVAIEHALSISAAELLKKQLRIIRRFEAGEHQCWADPARLQQVLWNLVKNAVKFTPVGGEISLRTYNGPAQDLIVEIADTGIGIAPDLLPRIFEAFEQGGRIVTSQYGGLGLGLAISKRVVDLHGGSLIAQSAGVGKGATFRITLKAMATSLLEGPTIDLPRESAPGTADILLVEDHEDTARVLRRILEHAGYGVAHAASIAVAHELVSKRQFDLVISDVGLPDGSGLDLMKTLRAEHALVGIALSGFGTGDDVAASSAAGFAEHLTKPVDWPQLRTAIERLLASKRTEVAAVL